MLAAELEIDTFLFSLRHRGGYAKNFHLASYSSAQLGSPHRREPANGKPNPTYPEGYRKVLLS